MSASKRGVGSSKMATGDDRSLNVGHVVHDMREAGKTYKQISKAVGLSSSVCWNHLRAYCRANGLHFASQSELREKEMRAVEHAADCRRDASMIPRYNAVNGLPAPGRSALDIIRATPKLTVSEEFALKVRRSGFGEWA